VSRVWQLSRSTLKNSASAMGYQLSSGTKTFRQAPEKMRYCWTSSRGIPELLSQVHAHFAS